MQGIHEEISSPRRKNKTQQQTISKVNYLVTPTKKITLEQTNTSKMCRINRSVLCVVNDYGKLGNEK